MAMEPDEEENQTIIQLQSTEQACLDDKFPRGANGYQNAGVEKGYEDDEEEYGSVTGMDELIMNSQSAQDVTQSVNPDPSSQRKLIQGIDQQFNSTMHHTDRSPPKFFSKPDIPEDRGFKYAIAPHVKKNCDLSVHTPPVVEIAAQTEKIMTKSLPKCKFNTRNLLNCF